MALELSKSLYCTALGTSQVLLYLGRLKFRALKNFVRFYFRILCCPKLTSSEIFLQVMYQDVRNVPSCKNQLGIRSSVTTL